MALAILLLGTVHLRHFLALGIEQQKVNQPGGHVPDGLFPGIVAHQPQHIPHIDQQILPQSRSFLRQPAISSMVTGMARTGAAARL